MTEKKFTLYSITQKLESINHELQSNCGEMSDEIELLLTDLSLELKTKTDGVVDFIKRETAKIDERKKRIDEISKFNKTKINALDSFKNYVLMCMDRINEKKIEGTMGAITKKKPSSKLEIFDQDRIPVEYIEYVKTLKIDTAVIKKQIQAGHDVPGAKIVDGKASLLIK